MTLPVTIGIPTFDRFAYLQEAVASALQQEYEPLDVLVSDDGTSDEIAEWCREVAARDSRLRYRRNSHRLRLAGNWNALADAALGTYLVLMGDDDRLLPGFVATLASRAAGADAVFCNHHVIDEGGRRVPTATSEWTARYGRDRIVPGPISRPEVVVWRNAIPMSATLVRTAAVRRLRFKEDLNTPELELFARLAKEGGQFVFEPEYLAEYRVHPGSETTRGLTIDRLAVYLESILVPADLEEVKRHLMEPLLVGAVGRSLVQGDVKQARRLLSSQYYPATRKRRQVIQRACASVSWLGPLLYRAFSQGARGVRTLRKSTS